MLHAGPAMVNAASRNLMTGETTTPPSSHYAHAVHRLRLTSRQVQHFQLMLQQYNRITQQQAHAGQELVGLSENSFSLSSLSLASSSQENSSGSAVSKQQGRSPPGAGELASDGAHAQTGPGAASAAAADDAQSPVASLEELFDQHLSDRSETLRVSAVALSCLHAMCGRQGCVQCCWGSAHFRPLARVRWQGGKPVCPRQQPAYAPPPAAGVHHNRRICTTALFPLGLLLPRGCFSACS